jgi:hypothetical protein
MAHLHRTLATLRIAGEDLDPAEITALLGCSPTKGQRKGDVFTSSTSGRSRTARFGMWCLDAADRQPENFDGQIEEILTKLTPSIDVWVAIAKRYKMDLFCGLMMRESNEGAEISPASLVALGQRGIQLSLDIYSPTVEDLQEQHTYWVVRGTLEEIAELLEQHGDSSSVLAKAQLVDDDKMWAYVVSDDLWGGAGSVADQAVIGVPDARKKLDELLIRLGREQIKVGRVNARTEMWLTAFEK